MFNLISILDILNILVQFLYGLEGRDYFMPRFYTKNGERKKLKQFEEKTVTKCGPVEIK